MEYIIMQIEALKDDKPWIYITDDVIKDYIEDNIELLIKEIKENL